MNLAAECESACDVCLRYKLSLSVFLGIIRANNGDINDN